jgi:hypothetical protein
VSYSRLTGFLSRDRSPGFKSPDADPNALSMVWTGWGSMGEVANDVGVEQDSQPDRRARGPMEWGKAMVAELAVERDVCVRPDTRWGSRDLNPGPTDYESAALTS